MALTERDEAVLRELLRRHGQTFAEEAGIVVDESPGAAFQVLVLSLLLSARIRAEVGVRAAAELLGSGWVGPSEMAASTWEQRVEALDRAGYARYDERTARQLATCAQVVLDEYSGDLSRLRDRAGRHPATERRLLQQFPGIGQVGATIFTREMQSAWAECYPYADERALAPARLLGLPDEARELAGLAADRSGFVRLVAALVRCGLARDAHSILAAGERHGRP